MSDDDVRKTDLRLYLQRAREPLLWKLDGLSERQVRLPMTRTGTNLLGLVKHVATMAAGYLGEVFDRPHPRASWLEPDAEEGSDMWAAADESRELIVAFWHDAWSAADATVDALDLDATGVVPWWPAERRNPTLGRIVVHMIAETDRHAGHADVVRELIDGSVGFSASNPNLTDDDAMWTAYRDRLQRIADTF